jgi:uncharacterized FAD-dependent dehydrogenase
MSQLIQIQITPEQAKNELEIKKELASVLNIKDLDSFEFRWKKRSLDARKKQLKINGTFEVFLLNEPLNESVFSFEKQDVNNKEVVHIIGAGPAGLYAALQAIQRGVKPILFERGKEVRARRRDLAALNKEQIVNPESNYCFGEGGAGTYSDGKLYTRSKKRGDVEKAMQWLVAFGAESDILVDAHPHIGTNKLPKLIENIRNTIIECGGEVYFESKMTDIHVENGKLVGVTINGTSKIAVKSIVLATGHSARDIFYLLHERGIRVEAKPFALGVRIEHAQNLIDKIQYHGRVNDEFVPPASYSLVAQIDGRGVYSFCMCPGGIIAPCATEQEEVVTNGWSPSKRNNPYSNSGIVVSISPDDFKDKNNPFVCLDFQKSVEKACWEAAGKTQRVPAQCMKDFVEGKISKTFPRSSYQPGIVSVNLDTVLPDFVAERLRKAFIEFGRKMPGYLTNDAVLHAPESRTSSPVQIPRNKENLMHPEVSGLFPCAEGAGYAGGIISAAIDGMKCMDEAIKHLGIQIPE